MRKEERKIYCKCITGMAIAVIMAVILMTRPVSAKKAVLTDDCLAVDNFTAEDAETDLRTVFDENSAMPCVDRESFEKWMETYESQTSEEILLETGDAVREDVETETQGHLEESDGFAMETKGEISSPNDAETHSIYMVNGEMLNPELQAYLYQRLSEQGCETFFRYAILICYQESHFNIYAENPNGQDKGLFQFRLQYYTGRNIFDPYEQIDIFAEQMGNRARQGLDVYEMISRHNVSDFGSYNEVYVSQVLAHEPNLKEVKQ